MNIEHLKYPEGKFIHPGTFNSESFKNFTKTIEEFPSLLIKEVGPLTPTQQDWIYRPDGWTIKQVVHHCADSHMNAFIRMKLALTEDCPQIKPYHEAAWAKQMDYKTPIVNSIKLLEGLHIRWSALLKSLGQKDLSRTFLHPENGKKWDLFATAGLYDWHCLHHLGHIKQAKKYQGEFYT